MEDYGKLSSEELFKRYFETKDIQIRDVLLERYLYIAKIAAKKFSGRGVDYDDLLQTASLALVKAIERFDPNVGVQFQSYATPSLIGEIKNYFRDTSRTIRLPRRDGEILKKLNDAVNEYTAKHGDAPTPAWLAAKLEVPKEKIFELLEMKNSVTPLSLDNSVNEKGDEFELSEILGEKDGNFEQIEINDMLKRSLAALDEEERKLIVMRYFKNMTQQQIAKVMGISQMQVSRMERKILQKMKAQV